MKWQKVSERCGAPSSSLSALATRLERRLTVGSRPKNENERSSICAVGVQA